MTLSFGVDPDLHNTAIGAWDDSGPKGVMMFSTPRQKGITGGRAVLDMVLCLGNAHIDQKFPHLAFGQPDVIVVEGQELKRGGGNWHKRPQDIVTLGQVAGAILAHMSFLMREGSRMYFPIPSEWKGSVPKSAMQARLYDSLGWGYTLHGKGSAQYATPNTPPPQFADLKAGEWKHAGDALLLAKWGHEQT
jgi:hypothetical protein